MLLCVKCQMEFEDGNKFCSNCGSPLTSKESPTSSHQNPDQTEVESFDGKLFCPNCKIAYEFGSSCIKCGAALGGRSSSPEGNGTEVTQGPEVDLKPVQEEAVQEQQIETPKEKFICPHCKIFYDKMRACIRCGSDLITFQSFQNKEEPQAEDTSEVKQDPPLTEDRSVTSEEKLVCPYCNTVYIAENGCRKCGPQSRKQPPYQGKQIPKTIHKPEKIKEDLEAAYSQEIEEEPLQPQTSEKKPLKKIEEEIKKRLSLLSRKGKDLRRSSFEAASIIILMIAAGYFLWSIYSNFIMKAPEPSPSPSRESAPQAPLVTSPSIPTPTTTPEAKKMRKEPSEKNAPVSTGNPPETPPSSPLPIASGSPAPEVQELAGIRVLLDNVRMANLKKDIHLFMLCYANDFKDREKKRKSTLEIWDHFSYLDLAYELRNPSVSDNTAKASVEWRVKFFTKTDRQPKESKTTLSVMFKKEGKDWKIKDLRQEK